MTKHLINLSDWTADEIEALFESADDFRLRPQRERLLANRTFLLFFPESSLRTRLTFERGIRELGGDCILFPPSTLDKREELRDVAGYAANWADGLIVRHSDERRVRELAQSSPIPVVNAMTFSSHPCEILADLYALKQRRPDYRNLTYVYVGPMSNIGRSWAEAAKVLDMEFRHVCAEGYELDMAGANPNDIVDARNYTFYADLEQALKGSDVILTDSLPDDLRTPDYFERYQLTAARLRLANPGALLNPCPPFCRGEEVSDDAIESEHFVGYGFKQNLLTVQQAIIVKVQREGGRTGK
ncbi:ornithine carbamoyltransferase [Saccharibacillus sacchari]|uniref:Ornithine carbamoyltransferase n=1 Tax=Saccharibacillus sacchari TaxID=456493 RepID=A0ACC6PGT8_9BACL